MREFKTVRDRVLQGGAKKYHEKNTEAKKLFARERIALLVDSNSFIEDGMFANCENEDLPSDGIITGFGKIQGRTVAILANDSTVKAGSWGARTVEKIIRLQEMVAKLRVPILYLVDSAGARITDQVEMFPGRRGAGRIFRNEANFSGAMPQICLLFGPSAAGGAYIPAFCDVVIMVNGNASMYLGSPRMAQMVIGENVTLEEMGGAKMHCSVSGVGDFLVETEKDAIELAKRYLSYFPQNHESRTPAEKSVPAARDCAELEKIIPTSDSRAYDMNEVIKTIVDKDSFLEIKALFAKELIVGVARLNGEAVGVLANQTMVKGGVLFVDSSDKAARFIQLCDAFNLPLIFLADVPGFMIGSQVEKQGMIRAGAKMIYAVSTAQVPKISVIVRKAFGAGLYAMCGPSYDADAVLALPTAQVAVMGPEPAVNAVYFNKLESMDEAARKAFMAEKVAEYQKDVNIQRLASELVVDDLVEFKDIRNQLIQRFDLYQLKTRDKKRHPGILPM